MVKVAMRAKCMGGDGVVDVDAGKQPNWPFKAPHGRDVTRDSRVTQRWP